MKKIGRALLSVSDKTGLVELGKALARHGAELVSTGGTAKALREAGLPVTEVAAATGHKEILGGRVKTLHPKVHGGILARRARADDRADLETHGIVPIDLVVVNLYPFEKAVEKGASLDELLEEIDIGGVALLRAAAKSFEDVTVVADPARYGELLRELEQHGGATSRELRARLAVEAFERTSAYDRAISGALASKLGAAKPDSVPPRLDVQLERVHELRYGENPHQAGGFFVDRTRHTPGVATSRVLSEGKTLSYNNILDLDAALALVRDLEGPAVCVVKHASPCGVAEAATVAAALEQAWEGDPLSAFGGIVALNRRVDLATAELLAKKPFVEAAIAPGWDDAALAHLATKPKWGKSVRLLSLDQGFADDVPVLDVRSVVGGFLVQERDRRAVAKPSLDVVTKRAPTEDESRALQFAWRVTKHVRSNGIVIARAQSGSLATVGIGGGLPSRVDAVEVAARKAGERAKGGVLASDGFFPFPDGVEAAARAGVTAVIEPGGSVKDQAVIEAADKLGLAMVFTRVRHFRH
jgi:phosphoribosylaminoimidazolecarboxamide formyltransferase/IMP cyclohydrolase